MIHQPSSSVQQLNSGGASFLGNQNLDVGTALGGGLAETQPPVVEDLNLDVAVDPNAVGLGWPNDEQMERLIGSRKEDNHFFCRLCGSHTPDPNLIMTHIL